MDIETMRPETIENETNENNAQPEEITGEVVVTTNTQQTPLTTTALQYFSAEKQKEIVALSEQIDVLQFEKIKAFGSNPIKRTVELCDSIIKDYENTDEDRAVMNELQLLAKEAKESYAEFSLALNEPNRLQKFLSKIFSDKKDNSDELTLKAKTCFALLLKLHSACVNSEESLKKTFGNISVAMDEECENCYELEEYIVAGRIAEERIALCVEEAKHEWEESGLITAKDKYESLRDGLEIFETIINNLEKSRLAHALSRVQLKTELRANAKTQLAVQTQKDHSIMVCKQQIRNALFNATNKEAIESQKSVALLNSELMKKVSSDAVITAKEAEELIGKGIYTIEAAMEAATTVINGVKEIEAASMNVKQNMKADIEKLRKLFDELEPLASAENQNTTVQLKSGHTTPKNNKLVF